MAKRAFDVIVAAVALLVLLPVLAIVALAIVLDSPGPVLYLGWRVGRYGKPFRMAKFRSMVTAADRSGPSVTYGDDPRITRVGRILRRTKLDELPNLLNVLRGEMSIVGPRPESLEWVQLYTLEQRRVLDVRPGITGLVQIRYRHEEKMLDGSRLREQYTQLMQKKLAIDLEYVQHQSLMMDLRILVETVGSLVH
ncbi:MAG: sugar transferase [Anaerolineae bacterium]